MGVRPAKGGGKGLSGEGWSRERAIVKERAKRLRTADGELESRRAGEPESLRAGGDGGDGTEGSLRIFTTLTVLVPFTQC